jgi:hypothetical protein
MFSNCESYQYEWFLTQKLTQGVDLADKQD